jgi:uncharacterized RDD family membrane protein YckC/type II secretory pathway pseudopilin PulG
MFCSRCGMPLQLGASSCPTCSGPAVALAGPPPTAGRAPAAAQAASPAQAIPTAAAPEDAGFWLRLVAYVVDGLILAFVSGLVSGVITLVSAAGGGRSSLTFVPLVTMLVVQWLYFALFESSAKQATLGKMALGLAVSGVDGRRIGFGRATGRFFGKIVSAIPLCVGFLLAGFTRRKQGLHDLMASTLVTRKGKTPIAAIVVSIAAVLLGGVLVVGILAAIAIPNFLRYQLRAKAGEATTELAALARSELAARGRTGRLVPLEVPADGVPGARKMSWSAQDAAAAQSIGWTAPAASYFTYRVAVEGEAFSACAESDIDGDGRYAAYALFHPDATGRAPSAPCPNMSAAERTADLEPGDPVDQVIQITRADVF